MSIQEINLPYEILYRLNEDGTVAGCHRRDLQIVKNMETGQVYSAKESDPMPIEGAEMDAVLGVITAAQQATIATQGAQISGLQNQLTEKNSQLKTFADEITRLTNELAAATAVNGEVNAGAE